jgi:pimeloyl-ACP methyl ester carboxylesterase
LALDHEWGKPVGAVLDYFHLDDVTLLGVSMGGWFCLRAAAFESRVKRVISMGAAPDYMKMMSLPLQWFVKFLCKFSGGFINWEGRRQMRKGGMQGWSTSQSMYITKAETPVEALDLHNQLSEKNLYPERIKQDVLVLNGEKDHLIPIRAHEMQMRVLTNTKSLEGRVFTEKEQAQNHCQVGNTELALDVMLKWLTRKLNNPST